MSWAWVGNGFTIDIIIAIVAVIITIGTVFLYRAYKNRKSDDKKEPISSDNIDEQQQITCFSCGEIFNKKDDHCTACGSPRPVCIVCFSEFRKKEVIVILPCCSNYAHKEHIENYLEIKGQCPKCHQEIKIDDLEEVSI